LRDYIINHFGFGTSCSINRKIPEQMDIAATILDGAIRLIFSNKSKENQDTKMNHVF
jgi:hypothetical protein